MLFKHSSTNKFRITHFIYNESEWAEDRIPKQRGDFMNFVCCVQKAAEKYENSRIVVHAQ
jgi:hypothetical protein